MEDNSRYEEIGKNYRLFLSWRYGVIAAYFVLVWGTLNLSLNGLKIHDNISGLILIIASFICVFLWIADCRTRNIFRNLIEKGGTIENTKKGAYSVLDQLRVNGSKIFSQSMTIDGIFVIIFFSFFISGFILLTNDFIKYNALDSSYKFTNDIKCWTLLLGIGIPIIISSILMNLRRINKKKNEENVEK